MVGSKKSVSQCANDFRCFLLRIMRGAISIAIGNREQSITNNSNWWSYCSVQFKHFCNEQVQCLVLKLGIQGVLLPLSMTTTLVFKSPEGLLGRIRNNFTLMTISFAVHVPACTPYASSVSCWNISEGSILGNWGDPVAILEAKHSL